MVAWIFRSHGTQGINWTFPYFSGAANFRSLYDWQISPEDYDQVKGMTPAEHGHYRYARADKTVEYTVNNYGYVLVALAARNLFFWAGDAHAVVYLQVLVHVALSLLTLAHLRSRLQRGIFFVLFAINPLILYFVTFPFYYYWAAVPSLILVATVLREQRWGMEVLLLSVLLFVCFLIRPTTLFVSMLIFMVWLRRERKVMVAAGVAVFCALAWHSSGHFSTSPWHTMYVGLGAYSNPYGMEGPFDEAGFKRYTDLTGKAISTHAITGDYSKREVRQDYYALMRSEYLNVVRESPLGIMRNAAYNLIQSFGFGYRVSRPVVQLVSGVVGLIMIGLIVWTHQWMWGVGVLAVAGSFAPYFPPIPAYLFGAFPFTALAAGGIAETLWRKRAESSGGRTRSQHSNERPVPELTRPI